MVMPFLHCGGRVLREKIWDGMEKSIVQFEMPLRHPSRNVGYSSCIYGAESQRRSSGTIVKFNKHTHKDGI